MSYGLPAEAAPPAPVCYLHPERETWIQCTRCGRPICPECMTAAAVGYQCPECVRAGAASIPTIADGVRREAHPRRWGHHVADGRLRVPVRHDHAARPGRRTGPVGDAAAGHRPGRPVVPAGLLDLPACGLAAHRLQHVRAVRPRPAAGACPGTRSVPDPVHALGHRRLSRLVLVLPGQHPVGGGQWCDLRPDDRLDRRGPATGAGRDPDHRPAGDQRRAGVLPGWGGLAGAPRWCGDRCARRAGAHHRPRPAGPGPGRPAGRGLRRGARRAHRC